MSEQQQKGKQEVGTVTGLYNEHGEWATNLGEKTIHAKRMPGRFRTLKYITESFWLIFFFGAYLRWDGKQALLLDVNNRQFHIFGLTILPQDIWMVSLLLLLLAMTLFAVTSVASRVFCGFFCFQTSWVDLFTWIEEKIEGNANARHKLDSAPLTADKFRKKAIKHIIWFAISVFTGISFTIWFEDAFVYWHNLLRFDLSMMEWATLVAFTLGTYFLAGFLREQTCLWLCPYARIQGVMADSQTIFPTYDDGRGEPRGRLRRGTPAADDAKLGDCIDCFQCVQVCPTGVDIRDGQQLGCITCGLCLDACDSVMDKIGRPRGLIRYASLDEMNGKPVKKLHQHPRTLVYVFIILLAFAGIVYGLSHLGSMTLRVEPERQPLFVRMSDGSIQNKYNFKVLNKTDKDIHVRILAEGGVAGQIVVDAERQQLVHHGKASGFSVFVKAPGMNVKQEVTPLRFIVVNTEDEKMKAEYQTVFNAPKN
ncbi:MAG: cytochrome c oxidase accessory protein CcoG [Gallionella sp.]|nr:cytochrome c oxidase accessory protein CcoG [Gallionella sp.]MDD4947617.1 cytochrome c oxidase accessory protein CcoG [Gallionella sp.]